ncbi:MAG: DUF5667 domain-containing protein [Nocardioidaceae bacterium]
MRSRLSRRDVEAFAAAVDGRAPHTRDAVGASRVREYVDIVDAVRATSVQTTQREFVIDLRAQLMAAAVEELSGLEEQPAPEADRPRHRRRAPAPLRLRRRLAAAATAFVVVGGSFGLVAASAQSMPGDMLYPVKRATERAELILRDGAGEGRALLDHAATRLDEVEALAAGGESDADDLIAKTLADFTEDANAGGDLLFDAYSESGSPDDIDDVRRFTAESAERLERLADNVPQAAATEYADAANAISGLDSTAVNTCPTCGDGQPPVNVDGDLLTAVSYVLDKADASVPSLDGSGRTQQRSSASDAPDSTDQEVLPDLELPVLPEDSDTDPSTDNDGNPSDDGDPSPNDDGSHSDDSLLDDVEDTTDDLTGNDSGGGDGSSDGSGGGGGGLLAPITDPVTELLDGLNGL